MAIVCEGYFPRWRSIWQPQHKIVYISAHILLLAAIMDVVLNSNVPMLLPLRESDLLTLTVSNLTLHLLFKLNLELRYAYFVLAAILAAILESNTIGTTRIGYLDLETIKFDTSFVTVTYV